jgi:group I intron endonuclease
MRDVNNGWMIRYFHANTASFFFIFVYLHIGRNIYYGSFKSPRILPFSIGVIIFVLMIATAFLGFYYSPTWIIFIFLCIIFNIYYLYFLMNINNVSYNYKNKNSPIIKKTNSFFKNRRYYSTISKLELENSKSKELIDILQELNLNYVLIYENLQLKTTQERIKKETNRLSGVYMIINKVTKDFYIGSAATNRFFIRFKSHLIYFRGSKIVKYAVKKYELTNFAFLILELYPNIINKENNKELLNLEDKYLKSLVPYYNILTEAGSSFGYKHTELTRQKLKDNYSDLRRQFIGNLNKGRTLTSNTIQKIREKALKRKAMSEETKKKCIKNVRPVILNSLDDTICKKFDTIKAAAKFISCSEKTIRRALNTQNKILKKKWKIIDWKKNHIFILKYNTNYKNKILFIVLLILIKKKNIKKNFQIYFIYWATLVKTIKIIRSLVIIITTTDWFTGG